MSKVVETLDLRTRLEKLHEAIGDKTPNARLLVEGALRRIGTISDYNNLATICNEMKSYDWLAPVDVVAFLVDYFPV